MSDIFERSQQQNFFQLPETPEQYRQNTTPTENTSLNNNQGLDDTEAAAMLRRWNEEIQNRADSRNEAILNASAEFSSLEYDIIYNLQEKGILNNDDVYRYAFSKELSSYLNQIGHSYNTSHIYNNYDEFWTWVSADWENSYKLPRSRWEAITNSIQIARNMAPLGSMGNQLQALNSRLANARGAERDALQQQADALWNEILAIRKTNEELGSRFPTDALTTIATSTIQSAPLTLRSIIGGGIGGLVGAGVGALTAGAPGAIGGFKMGYGLGSFAASSTDMAGLLYIDMLAAGVESGNAANLALAGGALQGFIESGLGVVAGWGTSAVKAIGGRVLSQEVQKQIAEQATKNFLYRITHNGIASSIGQNALVRTLISTAGQTASEGLEEALQMLVEQATLSIADAMQDAPVDRNTWGSPEFWKEMQDAIVGGLAGGLGFGLIGLPLNITGNISQTAKQTEQLRNMAVTIDNEAEFVKANEGNSFTANMSEEQLREVYRSQEPQRQAYRSEESRLAEELRDRRLYGAMDQSGDVYRGDENILYMEHSRHTESNGITTGEFAVGDPRKSERNSYAIGNYELRGDTAAITEFRIGQKYEGLKNEILQNFANDIGKEIEYSGQRYAPNGEGTSLRFGWGEQTNNTAPNTRQARGFYSDGQPYTVADTQADITAKQNFASQLRALNTQLTGDAQINTVVDFYDTVGRKWFGMSFDSFMNRMTGSRQQGWVHQNLNDEQIARWFANSQGVLSDAAAIQRIQENLTDAQREEAAASIHGFASTGADGVTKAIYAARNADVSTFIHEGVHAFTKLAEAVDPALYREMMEAAGLNIEEYNRADAAGKEQMNRQAMEKLAYGAEAYLKEGPKSLRTPEVKNLYMKIKEFLKDLADAIEKGKFLTPEVRSLFDNLFGEEADDAASENVNKTSESVTKTEENVNKNTESVSGSEEYELYSEDLKRKIKDKSLPIEERSKAVMRNAELEMLDEQDRDHAPTAELIKRARRITDPALQKNAIKNIRELRKKYAGTNAEFKAPNGNESFLLEMLGEEKGREAWYAVRLENFKNWFGDWETAARIAELEKSPNITLDGNSYEGKYELNKESILDYLKNTLRKEKLRNPAIDADIKLGKTGINKIIGWGMRNDIYKKLFAHIPEITKKAIFLTEEKANKEDSHYNNYYHLACGIEIDCKPYTVHIVLGENAGIWYYSHILLNIDKNKLITKLKEASQPYILHTTEGHPESTSLSEIKDTTLLKILQVNSSKVVDENGEPMLVFHGSNKQFEIFKTANDWGYSGAYFNTNKNVAKIFSQGNSIYDTFINLRNPLIIDAKNHFYDSIPRPEEIQGSGNVDTQEIVKYARDNNYDGVIINNVQEHGGLGNDIITFNSNQIKSASGNIGSFDPQTDNIYFQSAFHGSPFINDFNRSNYFQHGWGRTFYSQKEAAEWAQNAITKTKGVEGQLLNASIPDDTNLLHWDKTIAEQPETVKKITDSLITWNINNKSEFNPMYNIRKFNDGSYGFYRSIDGKMKWETIEEAQATAKEEIKKTLTGEAFYNTLAEKIGKKETSLLLDHLGIKGTKYYDKNTEKIGVKSGYNYVIYGDSEIEINDIYFQSAFHGSPYRFDRFDSSHMGSGEGAQAYGWGHYFAGKKEVAEWYRRVLSPKRNEKINGKTIEEWIQHWKDLSEKSTNKKEHSKYITASKLLDNYIHNNKYGWSLKKTIELSKGYPTEGIKLFENIAKEINEGQLYEVDIPGDEEMLDWDKKIEKQPEYISTALEKIVNDGLLGYYSEHYQTGEALYRMLSHEHGKQKASMILNEYGIRGIRYLDGSSRSAGEGSYNYVIFDDSEIDITQTYYSEAFRDAGLSDFMVSYPDIVKQAAQFKSGAEMAEYYADYFAMPDEVFKKAKALGYFDAIARAVKEGNAENATNAISGVSAEKAASALAAYGADITIALEAAVLVRQDKWQDSVQLLEKHGVPRIDAEVYADTAKLFSKPEMSWLDRMALETKTAAAKENKETIKIGKENPKITRFFNTLVDGAKEIYPDNENETLRTELAGEERTAKSFVNMINTDKGFDDFITAAYAVQRDGRQRGETEAETKHNEAIFERAQTVFNTNNGNWKVAFENLAAGKKVNEHTKQIIRGMIRNRPLQYMEAWAIMTGDDTWLPEENDIKRIKRLDTEGLVDEEYLEKQSPEELERIGRRLSSDRIKKKIDNKTLLLYDPEFNEYERQLKEDMAKARKLIAEREEGFKEYRHYLELARSNARKQQILFEQEAFDTSDTGLKISRERVKELSKAHQQVRSTINEMERFMREDLLPSQREAFLELRNQLRENERIQSELKAIAEIREIKKRNLRQILRKLDLKTVSLREAKYIEWIQAHFDSYEAVARFIGRGAKNIRQLYNEFATNAEYRDTLKKKLPQGTYKRIEKIVYEDVAAQKVRAYGKINAHDRRVLYRHFLDHQAIFEEMGIDIIEEPRKFSDEEWAALHLEMQDRIPADILYKLEGLLEPDPNAERIEHTGRRFKVENFTIEDLQTLAGVVSSLRKEGREREAARKDARSVLRQEAREKILKTIEEHMPKNAIGYRMKGTASTILEEEKRSGLKGVWYSLHNARRFFRRLEGGIDGYLYNIITQREYSAFDQENRNVFRRREEVEKKLKEAKIDLKDLGRIKFKTFDGKEKTLDEMLTFYYAQFNDRAFHAVVFGNFASQEERNAIKTMAENLDLIGQMHAEAEIAKRYHDDMKKLDEFFAKDGNEKYKLVMTIIGEDYDSNYERLKEFVAREYNEELGSEQYYMPLMRQGIAAKENTDIEQALADNGLSNYINKGFTKGRVDIPSFGQQAIQAGFYAMWDRMAVKQEHLMAYDPLHRELLQIFKGQESETLRDTLRSGHTQAAIDFIEKFISELAAPSVQDNFAALDKVSRMLQGHYPAAVLGWRIASIVKQAIESPPPFFQYVFPWEYAAAGASCLKQETRDMIREKSVYMKARYFDPAAAVVKEMERMYLTGKLGKAEAVLSKVESMGMKGQEWIDAVCVMPGWLAAYNKKFAELNNKNSNKTSEEIEIEAVKYADQIVRDCQPSSVLMDQIQMLKGEKHPLAKMFMMFQTPIASIFGQLFIDAPANFKQGRVLQALWTWGIYALLAIVIGAMHEEDDDDEWDLKKRGIDAFVMPISMIPILGGDLSYAAESFMRDGKIRTPRRSNFPVLDQGIRSINKISDEEWDKAGIEALKGFMYLTGLPVAAWNDIEKAVETERPQRIFGIK